jgi:hypothetical protein
MMQAMWESGQIFVLPEFPGKIWIHTPGKLEERRLGLHQYLQNLIALPKIRWSRRLEDFLDPSQSEENQFLLRAQGDGEFVLSAPIEKARELFEVGDIILFNTDRFLCNIQRAVTFSSFDHVGVIVREVRPSPGRASICLSRHLYLLECTLDGVDTYPLIPRLEAWAAKNTTLVYRSLTGISRTPSMEENMIKFLQAVKGKQYGLNLIQFGNTAVEEKASFFCSELVAAFYKYMGLLPVDAKTERFFPSTFAQKVDLENGASLSPALLLRFDAE